jgi:hypothetical protein
MEKIDPIVSVESLDVESPQGEIQMSLTQPMAAAAAAEITANDTLRMLVSNIIAFTPEVGDALSSIILFFWPPSEVDPLATWNSIKKYAEAFMNDLVDEKIAEERIKQLDKHLIGLRHVIESYVSISYGSPSKGPKLDSILTLLEDQEPDFLDKRNPERTTVYFLAFAIIYLTALREQVVNYKKIYLKEDPDAAKNLKTLQNKIVEYRRIAQEFADGMVAWRLSKITMTSDGSAGWNTTNLWTVQDSIDKNWKYPGSHDKSEIEYVFNNRRNQVNAQFKADTDILIESSYLWPYLDPTNTKKPVSTPVIVTSGGFGGKRGRHFKDNPNGKAITKIVMHSDYRFIKGVEVFYGSQSGGLHHASTGTLSQTLELEEGEGIVSAHGAAGDALEMLVFKTNKGRELSSKCQGGRLEWSAAPPEGKGATLVAIEGIEGDSSLEGITFHWQYMRDQ